MSLAPSNSKARTLSLVALSIFDSCKRSVVASSRPSSEQTPDVRTLTASLNCVSFTMGSLPCRSALWYGPLASDNRGMFTGDARVPGKVPVDSIIEIQTKKLQNYSNAHSKQFYEL